MEPDRRSSPRPTDPSEAVPWYAEARDELVRPDRAASVTLYFWQRWLPTLGPNAAVTLLWMRAAFASLAEPARGLALPPQERLAAALGLGGPKSLREALRRLERHGFVARRSHYERLEAEGRTVHYPDRYAVAMGDPVAPCDAGRLFAALAERVGAPELSTGSPHPGAGGEALGRDSVHFLDSVSALRAGTPSPPGGGCVGPQGPHTQELLDLRGVSALRAGTNVKRTRINVDGRSEEDEAAAEISSALGDPRSLAFYRLAARALGADVARGILRDALEARRDGRIRRSAAAYFTYLAKSEAASRGLQLGRRPCSS